MITPAQTFLKQQKIPHTLYEYNCAATDDFGHYAARSLGRDECEVCKTIILHHDRTYVTCIVPVNIRISMKNAARLLKLKDLEITDPATASRVTGYVVGGISPFGQKRRTLTLLHESVVKYPEILVSGGRRGLSIGVNPKDLIRALNATVGNVEDPSARA